MNSEFILLKLTRKNVILLLDEYNDKQLNTIPKRMNNNLVWNAAHGLVTQQLLCYYLSGLPLQIENYWVENFKKGTSPTERYSKELIHDLKIHLKNTAIQLEDDYNNGVFLDYKSYMTSYGFNIQNIEEAIKFNNIHEGLHYGYNLAIKNEI